MVFSGFFLALREIFFYGTWPGRRGTHPFQQFFMGTPQLILLFLGGGELFFHLFKIETPAVFIPCNKRNKKILLSVKRQKACEMIFFLLFTNLLNGYSEDFKAIFAEDYVEAVNILEEKEVLIDSLSDVYRQDAAMTRAIVFPELIRYNLIRDLIEKNTLEVVYVNTGMADFSIGPLQIKPSFAEKIEEQVIKKDYLNKFKDLFEYSTTDPVKERAERLERLKSFDSQLHYIFAFQSYMDKNHGYLEDESQKYRLRFLSTAYNYNFLASGRDIEVYMEKKFFPWGRLNDKKKYNYADISWYYYQNELNK